ncbi:MAG: MGMT family protein [Acutalibacteraceae bacterium]
MKKKSSFSEKSVYEYLTAIPKGRVVTYGQIGEALGNKNYARAVGNALHKNPDGEKYPCYKVVKTDGSLSKAYAFGGIEAQKIKLQNDGIKVEGYKVDLKKYRYK